MEPEGGKVAAELYVVIAMPAVPAGSACEILPMEASAPSRNDM